MAGPAATNFHPPAVESESAEETFLNTQSASEWIEQSLSDYTLSRMELAGVNTDQPWPNALPVVSTRLRNALSQFGALREVVIAATDQVESFRKTRNFGRKTLRELWVLLEKLAEQGAAPLRYGNPGAPPSTIDGLVTRVLQSLPEKDQRMLCRRYLEGATLEQIGLEDGVSRNAIRLRTNRILQPIRARMTATAQELLCPLI